MSGGLFQLIAVNVMNKYYEVKYSLRERKLQGTTNNPLLIARESDTVQFDGIIISCCDVDHITTLRIRISQHNVWTIPFKLLMKMCTVLEEDGYYYITFNKSLLGDGNFELLLLAISYPLVDFYLDADVNVDYYLMVSQKFYDNPKRCEISKKIHECPITNYQTFDVDTNINVVINPSYMCTGLFIESKYPIVKCHLLINSVTFIDNDEMKIKFYKSLISKRCMWTKKHSLTIRFILNKYLPSDIVKMIELMCNNDDREYLYWFSFSSNGSYINTNNDALIKFSTFHDIKLFIKSEDHHCNVHFQYKNILYINDGMTNVKYV